MLADVRLTQISFRKRKVPDAIARNRNQQVVGVYLRTISLSSRWRTHELSILKVEPTSADILTADEQGAMLSVVCCPTPRPASYEVRQPTEPINFPLLRNNAHFGLLVARPYFHIAPILWRCPSTRARSASTSSSSCGNGVA